MDFCKREAFKNMSIYVDDEFEIVLYEGTFDIEV